MNRIKALRQDRNMRQADLAILLNTKPQTVSRYEKGERGLDIETVFRLCDIFGCTADYLLGRSVQPTAALSEDEAQLLAAYRRSDDRARDMIRVALDPFWEENSPSSTADVG